MSDVAMGGLMGNAVDAVEAAHWSTRYALEMLPSETRKFHPGVRSHLTAALAQLDAVMVSMDPKNDQREAL